MSQTAALRRKFSRMTGLRTFAANPWTNGGTFDADAPYDARSENDLLAFLAAAEEHGFKADFTIRNTRMTITLTTTGQEA